EMMLLPKWAYFNIYAMSSWTRTIVIPLSIFYAYKPSRQLPEELAIRELFLEPPEMPLWPHPPTKRWLSWTNSFLVLDQVLKFLGPGKVKRKPGDLDRPAAQNKGVNRVFPFAFHLSPLAWLRTAALK